MVRQDKITYLITFFQNDKDSIIAEYDLNNWFFEYYYKVSNHYDLNKDSDIFSGNVLNTRVLYRLGILDQNVISKTGSLMTEFIPVNKHRFLFVNIQEFGKNICTALAPLCKSCMFVKICDYSNSKNIWAE